MGSRNSTTRYKAGPGFLIDKNGCVIDICGFSNSCNPNSCLTSCGPFPYNSCMLPQQCGPCAPCNPCGPIAPCGPCNPCGPCAPPPFPLPFGQPCCEPDFFPCNNFGCAEPQLNIYNYAYEKSCDPFMYNNPCFPTFSQRYCQLQPCFQKQYAQVSLNPFQCEPICDLPYIQPFVQSFANYIPQRCETPVFPPLAMPAVLPNAQQFLNPFANYCNQSCFPPPPPLPPAIFQQYPMFQPTPVPQPVAYQQVPTAFQPTLTATFQTQQNSFQPISAFQPSFSPICQPACQQTQMVQSCPTAFTRPCSLPIAMPFQTHFPFQPTPQPQQQQQQQQHQPPPHMFQNFLPPFTPNPVPPLLEHFTQLSARPLTINYTNPWV